MKSVRLKIALWTVLIVTILVCASIIIHHVLERKMQPDNHVVVDRETESVVVREPIR